MGRLAALVHAMQTTFSLPLDRPRKSTARMRASIECDAKTVNCSVLLDTI
jgi:hypothetical protein